MSMRRKDVQHTPSEENKDVFAQIDRHISAANNSNMNPAPTSTSCSVIGSPLDGMSEDERRAASLGVHPDAWRPIEFMNKSHYETLIKENALDESLVSSLEACKRVQSSSSSS